jgi:chemotaxis receptor (MCP) glutamine deamidase CheD
VPPDRFEVTQRDTTFCAILDAAAALCFYDAVDECGALLHLRLLPPGRTDPDVTDSVLAGDLLLLQQCVGALRALRPQARYWQCKMVVHIPLDGRLREPAQGVVDLSRAFLLDAEMTVVSTQFDTGLPFTIEFRPSMGQIERP